MRIKRMTCAQRRQRRATIQGWKDLLLLLAIVLPTFGLLCALSVIRYLYS
jgi:hypothetical protein